MHRLSSFLLLLALGTTSLADSHAVKDPAVRLVDLLAGIDSLYARYSQESRVSGMQDGEIWLRKPDRFRVVSGPPLSQTVVSDGQSLWTYDRDLEQVIVSDMDADAADIPVLLFAGDPGMIANHYTVESFADEASEHFLLQPLDDASMLGALALTFEGATPVRIVVENAMAERTTISLNAQAALPDEDDDLFAFKVPDHVDVIDDRQAR